MRIETYSYRYAEEILQHPKYRDVYDELIEMCRKCPVPVYPGKSEKQIEKDVVQQIMNTYFWEVFKEKGWEDEPLVTPNETEDSLRSDFRKKFWKEKNTSKITVQVEVEFGNVASSYRNYFKFQLSYAYDMADICVMIVPSWHLSNRIDSGVSNYEKVLREIPSAKLSIIVPILVIGLFDIDEKGKEIDVWNVKNDCVASEIVQNRGKKYSKAHSELVKKYIQGSL